MLYIYIIICTKNLHTVYLRDATVILKKWIVRN